MNRTAYDNTITVDKALELIKSNNTQSFKWYTVKGKGGCKYEIGGCNYKGNLELKIYVPEYKNGKPIFGTNDFCKSSMEIGYNSNIHPNDGFNMDYNKFMTYAKDIDLRKLKIEYEDVEVVTYKTVKVLKVKGINE